MTDSTSSVDEYYEDVTDLPMEQYKLYRSRKTIRVKEMYKPFKVWTDWCGYQYGGVGDILVLEEDGNKYSMNKESFTRMYEEVNDF